MYVNLVFELSYDYETFRMVTRELKIDMDRM